MIQEIRDSFVEELTALRGEREDLIVLVSDSSSTCRIAPFAKRYPDSLVNVGIAEQNLVGMAAGLSLAGFTSVTANAAPFLFGRSNEQVKVDVCYSETNVKLVGLNPGFAYGSLGPTHHCLDDISMALSLGNIRVFCPCDPEETRQIARYAVESEGPVYIRLDSFRAENIHGGDYRFVPGEPVIVRKGGDVTVIALGTAVHEALAAAEALEGEGIGAEVISLPSLRPLNRDPLVASLEKTGCAVTAEEHSMHGGIGAIMESLICEKGLSCPLEKRGVPAGAFAPASPRQDIRAQLMLDARGIGEACRKAVGGKK